MPNNCSLDPANFAPTAETMRRIAEEDARLYADTENDFAEEGEKVTKAPEKVQPKSLANFNPTSF